MTIVEGKDAMADPGRRVAECYNLLYPGTMKRIREGGRWQIEMLGAVL
jgi:hypothetical protein